MHVNRIYGGAIVGGIVAGLVFGFGVFLLMGIVTAIQQLAPLAIVGSVAPGLLGAFVGAFLGLAVGIGTSVVGAIVAFVVRILGERVSTPMMIIAGAVGTVPATSTLALPLRDSVFYDSRMAPLFPFAFVIVVAAIAAVSLDWLFSAKRNFGGSTAATSTGTDSRDPDSARNRKGAA